MFTTTNPKDNGTFLVGSNPANLVKGMKIKLQGEDKIRTITYVQGTPEKNNVHVAAKGSGPFPTSPNPISYEVVAEVIAKVA